MRSPELSSSPRNVILAGDVREQLAQLPEDSVDTVITSPPYFQLRDYGVVGQIGLEDDIGGWVDDLRLAMHGVARVLKASGSLWLNLGDAFSRHPRFGASPKSLLLGPERLALGLIEDGWIVRNKVIWAKTNHMPTPVRDRLSCQWEVIYLLTRQRRYFFDLDAIRVPHSSSQTRPRYRSPPRSGTVTGRPPWAGPLAGNNAGLATLKANGLVGHPLGKNPGDVWRLPPSNYRGAHRASFPASLVKRPLLATCPERVCRECGQPWTRSPTLIRRGVGTVGGLRKNCPCRTGWRPGLVLDPFFGAGTVGVVAEQLGRDWLGVELNPEYVRLAEARIAAARSARDERETEVQAA